MAELDSVRVSAADKAHNAGIDGTAWYQFLAAGEALKRLEKLRPGLLAASFPDSD